MRKQENFNKLVGRIGDEYYFCDYIFDDSSETMPRFKGATATILRPISKGEHEDRTNPERETCQEWFREIWKQQVADDRTEQNLQDFIQEVINVDGDEAVFDFSGYNLWDQLRELGLTEEEYPVFECIGGGRSFDADMEFDQIYDQELWDKIKKVETKAKQEVEE